MEFADKVDLSGCEAPKLFYFLSFSEWSDNTFNSI